MLSVIVAVHNQIGHNMLFLEGIRRYTTGPYEVVVVDNHSIDGSAEFFEANGCRVIRNPLNLCYPESMNLGIRNTKADYLCFINNDLYVGPNWDGLLIQALERFGLDVITPLGLEMMPTRELTAYMQDRWVTIGRGRLSSGKTAVQLKKKIRAMYGDWERFCGEVYRYFSEKRFDGLNGSCVMAKRTLFEKIGLLDERVQAADWDLYYTLRKREDEVGDVRRSMIFGGCYVHHFMRATVKGKREPFGCTHPRLSIDEKWRREEQARLWYKPEDFHQCISEPSSARRLQSRLGKIFKKLIQEIDRALAWRWLLVSPDQIVKIYRRKFMTA
jgi:glycosyltransferase involved in cell wall biosynthesis